MSDININLGGGFLLAVQIALLVLYYGNILPSLPWWVVWFPLLMVATILLGVLIIVIVGFFVFLLAGVID